MAYSTTNPPFLIVAAIAGGYVGGSSATAGNVWCYRSSDARSTVTGSSYFSNGYALQMRLGDPLIIVDTTNTLASWAFVNAVTTSMAAAQGGGGATVTLMTSGS